jgi:serine protease inhibitor
MSQDLTKVKIEGSVWAYWHVSDSKYLESRFVFYFEAYDFNHKRNIEAGHIMLSPYSIEIEMPAGLDLRKSALKGLQKKRKLILAENESKLNAIDTNIQMLMAIEHKE